MFNSLNEKRTTPRERWLRFGAIVVISLSLFGGLYAFVHFYD